MRERYAENRVRDDKNRQINNIFNRLVLELTDVVEEMKKLG